MANRVQVRKYGGDDIYSWATFLDGRPVVTGCNRDMADYHAAQVRKAHGIAPPEKRYYKPGPVAVKRMQKERVAKERKRQSAADRRQAALLTPFLNTPVMMEANKLVFPTVRKRGDARQLVAGLRKQFNPQDLSFYKGKVGHLYRGYGGTPPSFTGFAEFSEQAGLRVRLSVLSKTPLADSFRERAGVGRTKSVRVKASHGKKSYVRAKPCKTGRCR